MYNMAEDWIINNIYSHGTAYGCGVAAGKSSRPCAIPFRTGFTDKSNKNGPDAQEAPGLFLYVRARKVQWYEVK